MILEAKSPKDAQLAAGVRAGDECLILAYRPKNQQEAEQL